MAKEAVLYEAMYILDSSLTDEEIAALEEQFRTAIEGQGAQFESVHEFARRRLAYAIKGHTDGIYRVMYFRSSGAAVEEIKHEFTLSEDVVRGIVTVANPKMLVGPKPEPVKEAKAEEAEEAPAEVAEEAPGEVAEAPVEAAEEAPAEAAEEAPAEAAEAPAEEASEAPAETPTE
jgi:small subunit ribosomal protein S6